MKLVSHIVCSKYFCCIRYDSKTFGHASSGRCGGGGSAQGSANAKSCGHMIDDFVWSNRYYDGKWKKKSKFGSWNCIPPELHVYICDPIGYPSIFYIFDPIQCDPIRLRILHPLLNIGIAWPVATKSPTSA